MPLPGVRFVAVPLWQGPQPIAARVRTETIRLHARFSARKGDCKLTFNEKAPAAVVEHHDRGKPKTSIAAKPEGLRTCDI